MSKEDRMIELLEELVKWTKVTSIPKVKKLLLEILPKPAQKIAYQASDGKTRMEVSDEANVSASAISKWWEKWTRAGIAEGMPVKGGGNRAVRNFSLDDFGITIPTKVEETEKEGEEEKKT